MDQGDWFMLAFVCCCLFGLVCSIPVKPDDT